MNTAEVSLKPATRQHLQNLISRYPDLEAQSSAMVRAVGLLCNCHRQRHKILTCGNGGSAADSAHIVGELMKGFCLRRPLPESEIGRFRKAGVEDYQRFAQHLQMGIAAVGLCENAILNSAVANDNDPEMIFAQQVYGLGRPGDVLIGLSTSGRSRNVVSALKVARTLGLSTIGFTGANPAAMDAWCDVVFKAPATETYKVQEHHLPLYHTLCLMAEQELFG